MAAVFVVLHHAYRLLWVGTELPELASRNVVPWWITSPLGVLDFGRQAVLLFFILSGFCIHYRQAVQLAVVMPGRPVRMPDWYGFARRRITRLYPTLILALAFTALVDHIGMAVNPALYASGTGWPAEVRLWLTVAPYGFVVLLANIAMQAGLSAPWLGTNSPLWSLAYEFWFYVSYPTIFWLSSRYGPGRMFRCILVVSLIGSLVFGVAGGWLARVSAYWFLWCGGGFGGRGIRGPGAIERDSMARPGICTHAAWGGR